MNLFWSESTLHAKTNKNVIKKIIEGAEEAEKLVGNRVTTKVCSKQLTSQKPDLFCLEKKFSTGCICLPRSV